MNTHKEPIKIGDTVSYLNQGEYEVVGLSTMMPDDPSEPEWKITHTIKEVAIADIHKGIAYQKPCWVSVKDIAPLEPREETTDPLEELQQTLQDALEKLEEMRDKSLDPKFKIGDRVRREDKDSWEGIVLSHVSEAVGLYSDRYEIELTSQSIGTTIWCYEDELVLVTSEPKQSEENPLSNYTDCKEQSGRWKPEDPFDFVESCEPDCTPERHAYHQGQWDMAKRINKKHGYRGYPGAVEDEEPWQYVVRKEEM